MKTIGRLLLVAFLSVLGAVLVAAIAGQLLKPRWESLGSPIRPATNIVSISPDLIVRAMDGMIYRSCGDGCWVQSSDADTPSVQQWSEGDCNQVEIPSLDGLVDLKLECEILPVRSTYRAYAIDSDGFVYQWEEFTAEMSWAEPVLYGTIAAGIIFFIGILVIALTGFTDLMSQRHARALSAESDAANSGKPDR